MDEKYHQRQADQERKRLVRKVNEADKAISKAESAAEKALSAAAATSNAATAKSKQGEAERQRAAARRAREARTKATKAVADSQAKVNDHERRAREAAATARKKREDADKRDALRQKRAEDQARREQEREERRRGNIEAAQRREVTELRQRTAELTAELERQLAAVRAEAPKQITVLFLAGTPEGGERILRLDREFREIEEQLRASEYRDRIKVAIAHAVRINDILAAFNRHDPDVVHFSGHGDTDMLLLEGPDGRPHELRDEHLGLLLGAARKPIRLLVLNACFSAEQAAMATDYVEAAIGMDLSIADSSAKTFAGQFYLRWRG